MYFSVAGAKTYQIKIKKKIIRQMNTQIITMIYVHRKHMMYRTKSATGFSSPKSMQLIHHYLTLMQEHINAKIIIQNHTNL